jgi:hypothetical protein
MPQGGVKRVSSKRVRSFRACVSQLFVAYAGWMFWFSRSTFLGSYFFLISTRRA